MSKIGQNETVCIGASYFPVLYLHVDKSMRVVYFLVGFFGSCFLIWLSSWISCCFLLIWLRSLISCCFFLIWLWSCVSRCFLLISFIGRVIRGWGFVVAGILSILNRLVVLRLPILLSDVVRDPHVHVQVDLGVLVYLGAMANRGSRLETVYLALVQVVLGLGDVQVDGGDLVLEDADVVHVFSQLFLVPFGVHQFALEVSVLGLDVVQFLL